MSAGWRWVMVPQGYALLSSNKYTLAGKVSWEKFTSQIANVALQPGIVIAYLYYSSL